MHPRATHDAFVSGDGVLLHHPDEVHDLLPAPINHTAMDSNKTAVSLYIRLDDADTQGLRKSISELSLIYIFNPLH